MQSDFAIFICTHGRPDKQLTLDAIRACGYTGKWYLVLDDTDSTIQKYINNYGASNIVVFNKNYYINADKYDNGDNKLHAKCILYAKRAVEDIACEFGLKYFIIADDDIIDFCIRCPVGNKLLRKKITDFDSVLAAHIDLLKCGIAGIGFGTPVDYFGGIIACSYKNLSKKRVPYQFILRNAAFKIDWTCWFAEDDITEFQYGMIGYPWFVSLFMMYDVMPVGDTTVDGGMVDTYKNHSLYSLNFNVVRYCPERMFLRTGKKSNKIGIGRNTGISFPKILSWRYKRENTV